LEVLYVVEKLLMIPFQWYITCPNWGLFVIFSIRNKKLQNNDDLLPHVKVKYCIWPSSQSTLLLKTCICSWGQRPCCDHAFWCWSSFLNTTFFTNCRMVLVKMKWIQVFWRECACKKKDVLKTMIHKRDCGDNIYWHWLWQQIMTITNVLFIGDLVSLMAIKAMILKNS